MSGEGLDAAGRPLSSGWARALRFCEELRSSLVGLHGERAAEALLGLDDEPLLPGPRRIQSHDVAETRC